MNNFSDPRVIVEQMPIFAGQKIAEFGCGTGAYTFLLSKVVGGEDTGAVYAIDVQQKMIEQVDSEAKKQLLNNIHPIWGNIEQSKGSRLRDASVSVVITANTLFQVQDKKAFIQEANRILSPNGSLVVIDWSDSFGNIGPVKENIVTENAAKLLVSEQGFEYDSKINVGDHHYGFVAKKTTDIVNK